jgi:AbrB family looped-hinge helix DNA binding protein
LLKPNSAYKPKPCQFRFTACLKSRRGVASFEEKEYDGVKKQEASMKTTVTGRVSTGGRITIPAAVRRKYHISPGTPVLIRQKGDGFLMMPTKPAASTGKHC